MLVLLLAASAIITMVLANRKHVQQEVKLARMQADYQKELRIVENEVQEQVLTNVARELHDNIGQLLTLIRLQLEQEKLDNAVLTEKLQPVDDTLNDTIDEVRALSHSLNTEYIETKGLAYAIDKEIKRVSKLKKLQVDWEYDSMNDDLDKGRKVILFRIFQELLNNALKHAAAKNISILLKVSEGFYLRIEDDGVGFDMTEILNGDGSGLQNIQKRASLAGTELDMKSTKGKGSIFTLTEK